MRDLYQHRRIATGTAAREHRSAHSQRRQTQPRLSTPTTSKSRAGASITVRQASLAIDDLADLSLDTSLHSG
jgi:hypothetical protein